jgi:hypothetical protein
VETSKGVEVTVYQLRAMPDQYQILTTHGMPDWDAEPHWFHGQPIGAEWEPPLLRLHDDKRRPLPVGDFPSFIGTIPVFGERAVEALGDLLRAHGELLPIRTPSDTYYAFNSLKVIDALDEECSDIVPNGRGGILHIARIAFHADRLGAIPIFKIPETVRTFVTDAFVDRVKEAGLLGFRFDPVWPLPEPTPRRGGRRRQGTREAV